MGRLRADRSVRRQSLDEDDSNSIFAHRSVRRGGKDFEKPGPKGGKGLQNLSVHRSAILLQHSDFKEGAVRSLSQTVECSAFIGQAHVQAPAGPSARNESDADISKTCGLGLRSDVAKMW